MSIVYDAFQHSLSNTQHPRQPASTRQFNETENENIFLALMAFDEDTEQPRSLLWLSRLANAELKWHMQVKTKSSTIKDRAGG